MKRLEDLNRMSSTEAEAALRQCCGSSAWAQKMARARPFGSFEALCAAAERCFDGLSSDDWMQAFASHPRLGQKKSSEQSQTANAWSASEQSGVQAADSGLKDALAELNDRYFDKHGFTFILCATGRSVAEMIDSVRKRLPNSLEEERRIASGEQRKITRLRLERLVSE